MFRSRVLVLSAGSTHDRYNARGLRAAFAIANTQGTKNCATAGAGFLAVSKGLTELYGHGQVRRWPGRVSYQDGWR